MFCKNCGEEIKDGAKFCSKCGTPVEEIQQPLNTKSNIKKKLNIIVIVLIAIIVLFLLIRAIIIIRVVINEVSKSEVSSSEISSANRIKDFCYEGFSWDMSYDEANEKLEEMTEDEVKEGNYQEDENKKYLEIDVSDYDGLEGVYTFINVEFNKEQLFQVLLNLRLDDDCDYSIEDVYDHMVDKYKDIYKGVECASDDEREKWDFYDENDNYLGYVTIWSPKDSDYIGVQHTLNISTDD